MSSAASPNTDTTPIEDFNHTTNMDQHTNNNNVNNGDGGGGGGKAKKAKASAAQPVPPPDGGWGWVVVLSSFVVSVLVDGVCFTTGVFFNTFRLYFGTSKGQTAWVGSVLNGTYLTAGPVVSMCVNKYGCRPVAMFGAVFASVFFFVSTFSPTLPVLIVTFGFLGGLGFGFLYLPAIVMVGYYFEKKRALATGIACCGSGLGAFVFAPFCNYLLEEYGWKGATWILAGLVLNSLVFSIFYRPLEPGADKRDGAREEEEAGEEEAEAKLRLLGEGHDDDVGKAAGQNESRAVSSLGTATTTTAASTGAVVELNLESARRQAEGAAAAAAAAARKEEDVQVTLLAGRKREPSWERQTRALLGGDNERDDELMLRGESAAAKAAARTAKGGDEGMTGRLSSSAGDLHATSSSSFSPSPRSQLSPSNTARGDGGHNNNSGGGGGVSDRKARAKPAPANSSSRQHDPAPEGGEEAGGDEEWNKKEEEEGKGSDRHASWEAALELNGNAHPALADMIKTVTPELHRVSSEEAKTFMSDFRLQETNPVARMAFSQDVFGTGVLAKRRHPHHHQHQHHNHNNHDDHHDRHHSHNYKDVDNPLQRKDIFYSGSLRNIPEYQSAHTLAEYRQRVVASVCDDLDSDESAKGRSSGEEDEDDKGSEWSLDEESLVSRRGFLARLVCGPLRSMFDLSLLKSPTFDIYCMSCLLCMLGFFVPFIYLPTLCIELGISSSKAALIISIIGIANTVGRVAVGFVSDQPWADSLIINNVALVIGGVATTCVPFLHLYPLFGVYAFVFGSCIAIFVSLRSIIMVELMGLQKLTNAFGLVIMCQGISSFIGAPIAGLLSDMTGDYNISFYVAGTSIALSGLICFPLRRVARWEHKRELRQQQEALAMRRRKSKCT